MTAHEATSARVSADRGARRTSARREGGAHTRRHGARNGEPELAKILARIAAAHRDLAELHEELAGSPELQLAVQPDPRLLDDVPAAPETPTQRRPLLTAADVAERVQVDAKTVRRWQREGRMPEPLRLGDGSVIRWRPEDVDTWLDGRGARAEDDGGAATRAGGAA